MRDGGWLYLVGDHFRHNNAPDDAGIAGLRKAAIPSGAQIDLRLRESLWNPGDGQSQKRISLPSLTDSTMLPTRLAKARIFTCDWPASLFRDTSTIEMTIAELARSLLLGIQTRQGATPSTCDTPCSVNPQLLLAENLVSDS